MYALNVKIEDELIQNIYPYLIILINLKFYIIF